MICTLEGTRTPIDPLQCYALEERPDTRASVHPKGLEPLKNLYVRSVVHYPVVLRVCKSAHFGRAQHLQLRASYAATANS